MGDMNLLYSAYEMTQIAAQPLRAAAIGTRAWLQAPWNPWGMTPAGRNIAASADLIETLTRRYGKPEWRIDSTVVDDTAMGVTPESVWSSPWVNLIHFRKDKPVAGQPKVLLVAPLSGHYATLLRGTVEAFLPDCEVYITDWSDAKLVPMLDGRFDFHDYVDHVREMVSLIAPCHVVAVCQPGPPVLAAAALMAEDGDDKRPLSLTFIGSPIDARKAPTAANKLAKDRPFTWFSSNMIHTVPMPYAGVMRRVYPGFVQLAAFIHMNKDRHTDAHYEYFNHLLEGDEDGAQKHREFYDEYLAVLDLTEEFYLQTIDYVFQRHLLPKGKLDHRERRVKLDAITDIALMSIEGERDDIAGVGQTQAVHKLCPNVPDAKKTTLVQMGAGHYGIFTGSKFRREVYPKILAHINAAKR
jgi:poly(3-hydroxybutyrate) depolymerase